MLYTTSLQDMIGKVMQLGAHALNTTPGYVRRCIETITLCSTDVHYLHLIH